MKAPEPPTNIAAEEATLGSLLLDPQAVHAINGNLKAEHFYLLKHQLIFRAMQALKEQHKPIDMLTLPSELERQGCLSQVGGVVYIAQLVNATPSAINVGAYAADVFDAFRRRKVLELLSQTAKLAYATDSDLASAADSIQAQMSELLRRPEQDATFQSFAEIAPNLAPITWLWPGWIPQGMITLFGAVPGAGKSMIALDLAKRVIHGQPFPDGKVSRAPQNVIYVDAELVPQILKERAEAWQMDTSRLFLMLPKPNDSIDFGREEYCTQLRRMVETVRPGLVVIDSLSSVSTKGENNIEDIRKLLAFLNELASSYNIALVLIHHLRKRGGMQLSLPEMEVSIDDFRGSSHIIAMSRSVLALSVVQTTSDPDRNGPRKLQIVKSNISAYPDALGCEFQPLHPGPGVYLKWTEAPKAYREPSKVEQCASWLQEQLENEPLSLAELCKIGGIEGYSKASICRARQMLGSKIADTDGRQSPSNKWQLKKI